MLGFIHIQKTAGQTMRAILRKNFGMGHCDLSVASTRMDDRAWAWVNQCYRNAHSIGGHAVEPGGPLAQRGDVRFFTVLREPEARALSHYQHIHRRDKVGKNFEVWMKANANWQTRMLAGEANLDHAIDVLETQVGFTGLTECFNESLVLWRRWTGMSNLDIGYASVNVARSNHLREMVLEEPRNRELLSEHNQLDAGLYDYCQTTLYPSQKQAFGEGLAGAVRQFEQSFNFASNQSITSIMARVKRNLWFRPRFEKLLLPEVIPGKPYARSSDP